MIQSEWEYFESSFELINERNLKQINSLGATIPMEFILNSESLEKYNFNEASLLAMIFPASACGICYDNVMIGIQDLLLDHPNRTIYVITDIKALNDVNLYLADYGLQQKVEVLIRKKVFDIPIEGKGYPYILNISVNHRTEKLIVTNSLIPDKNDDSLTRPYLFNSLSLFN